MAISNAERIGKSLELLNQGLAPYVERELKRNLGKDWLSSVEEAIPENQVKGLKRDANHWDTQLLLQVMSNFWKVSFELTLGKNGKNTVSELIEIRNRWAHQKPFNTADALRALLIQ